MREDQRVGVCEIVQAVRRVQQEPAPVRSGDGSAAQTLKRYQGTPSSGRSSPNTSQAHAKLERMDAVQDDGGDARGPGDPLTRARASR